MHHFLNGRSWVVLIGTEAVLAGLLWYLGLPSPLLLIVAGCVLLAALWIWERRPQWIPNNLKQHLGFVDKLLGTFVVSPQALPGLRDLFNEDFKDGKGGVHVVLHATSTVDFAEGESIELQYRLHADFNSLAVFTVFYIPSSNRIFEICQMIGLRHQEYVNDVLKFDVHVGSSSGPATKNADLVFTGRVVIYHETEIDPVQGGQLYSLFMTRGLKPVFRSSGYALDVSQSRAISSLTGNSSTNASAKG